MWQTNPFVEKLGLDRLIIQAPMAGATTPELAAAVSNAGGLGGLGLATSPIEVADAQIAVAIAGERVVDAGVELGQPVAHEIARGAAPAGCAGRSRAVLPGRA